MSRQKYYQKTKDRPVRQLYVEALKYLPPNSKVALDLGCGAGIEVIDLVSRGFEVHAVDQEASFLEFISARVDKNPLLHTHASLIETWTGWQSVDFLFAYDSLPFCKIGALSSVLEKVISSVKPDGILAVSLLGMEDEWVADGRANGISSKKIRTLLSEFSILHFEEIKKNGSTVFEGQKKWHLIELIARR